MRKIFFVPIEPIEARYSTQWNYWFENFLSEEGIPYEYILPDKDLSNGAIRSGQFLDVIGTNFYKAQQLSILCEKLNAGEIRNNDVILFSDYWFPGLEMLFYIRDALDLKFKIAGILHAGTWDPNDFLSQKDMGRWAQRIERSWIEQADLIFVATKYHKHLIRKWLKLDYNSTTYKQIKVVPFPIYADISEWTNPNVFFIEKLETQPVVVFPHRLAPEKQPECFDEMFANPLIQANFKGIKTAELYGLTDKDSYYKYLARSHYSVSFAKQETFGIAMLESVLCGCAPIVPDRCSYPELYPDMFVYELGCYENDAKAAQAKLIDLHLYIHKEDVSDALQSFRKQILIEGSRAIPAMIGQCLIL